MGRPTQVSVCRPAWDYPAFDATVAQACQHIDNQDIVDALCLSSKEMMSNVREWQYGLDLSKQIYLSILVTEREVIVTIIDAGKAWREDGYYTNGNAEMELARLMEEGAEKGRGHHIMALLTHSIQYQNGGRVRILAWRLHE